ncbi:MAG: hypothetical protein KDI79_22255, partial [Anaerolineae bacterium]|nr:hypothetical protein [Anaerolineae bacterium]
MTYVVGSKTFLEAGFTSIQAPYSMPPPTGGLPVDRGISGNHRNRRAFNDKPFVSPVKHLS